MGLLDAPSVRIFKPMKYEWAYEYWLLQNKIHWLPQEVSLGEDIKDYHTMSESERHLLTQIFRMFTQMDVDVGSAYLDHYIPAFQSTEIRMMMAGFANTECIHVAAYSHILDTLGLPETEYAAFMNYAAMKEKHDYIQNFKINSKEDIAKALAIFSAFTEGVQLFASFVVLMNFPRHGKLRGSGQLISWSVRDEDLHCEAMLRLFNIFVDENPEIWTTKLKEDIYEIAAYTVKCEDAFIDLVFEMGPLENLDADTVKRYIRYIADRRLLQLRLSPLYKVSDNPCPWMDAMIGAHEHGNFFESRVTEYSKGSVTGSWNEAF